MLIATLNYISVFKEYAREINLSGIFLLKMEQNTKLQKIMEEFEVKPCSVKLDRAIFSKINVRCSELNLQCDMEQKNHNTFSIKIKRKMIDDIDENYEVKPKKQVKCSRPTVRSFAMEHSIGNTFVENISLQYLNAVSNIE